MPLFTSGGLGLGLVILVLVLRIWPCLHHCQRWHISRCLCYTVYRNIVTHVDNLGRRYNVIKTFTIIQIRLKVGSSNSVHIMVLRYASIKPANPGSPKRRENDLEVSWYGQGFMSRRSKVKITGLDYGWTSETWIQDLTAWSHPGQKLWPPTPRLKLHLSHIADQKTSHSSLNFTRLQYHSTFKSNQSSADLQSPVSTCRCVNCTAEINEENGMVWYTRV